MEFSIVMSMSGKMRRFEDIDDLYVWFAKTKPYLPHLPIITISSGTNFQNCV
jgi:hypothetical protein